MAVAAGDVGDVPNSISTSTVLQRATCHGVSETFQRTVRTAMCTRVVVRCRVVGAGLEGIRLLVPHGRVQLHILTLGCPLLLNFLIVDGIEQRRTIDTDG